MCLTIGCRLLLINRTFFIDTEVYLLSVNDISFQILYIKFPDVLFSDLETNRDIIFAVENTSATLSSSNSKFNKNIVVCYANFEE